MLAIKNRSLLSDAPLPAMDEIRKQLTIPNPKYKTLLKHGKGGHRFVPRDLKFFTEHPGSVLWFSFPRGFTREAVTVLQEHGQQPKILDHRRRLSEISLTFRGDLRDYQQRAVDDVLARDFGVLSAATGSGKTIMALAVIAARQQPTLILVHNKELLNQWRDRIKTFLGIEAGVIGGGKLDVQPVTVGIINTVRKHLDSLPEHFGHIVVDECHRTPASMFTEAVTAFDSKFMLGLSATAYRRDGLDPLIYWTLGQKVHQVDPQELKASGAVLTPEVIRRETSFNYRYRDDYSKMLQVLTKDQSRSQQIAQDVVRQVRERSGTALVVSDRIEHCMQLGSFIEGWGGNVRYLTGRVRELDRKDVVKDVQAGKVDVLVATVQLLGEGFDCPGLSSLFLATPIRFKGRLLQVVGRILRPADGKRPIVFDYVDGQVGVLKHQARHRGQALAEVSA